AGGTGGTVSRLCGRVRDLLGLGNCWLPPGGEGGPRGVPQLRRPLSPPEPDSSSNSGSNSEQEDELFHMTSFRPGLAFLESSLSACRSPLRLQPGPSRLTSSPTRRKRETAHGPGPEDTRPECASPAFFA